jgi:hypothetical protein
MKHLKPGMAWEDQTEIDMNMEQQLTEFSAKAKSNIVELIEMLNESKDLKTILSIADVLVFNYRSPDIVHGLVSVIKRYNLSEVPDSLVYYVSECWPEYTVDYFDLWIDMICESDFSVALSAYYILNDIKNPDSISPETLTLSEAKLTRCLDKVSKNKKEVIENLLLMFIPPQ